MRLKTYWISALFVFLLLARETHGCNFIFDFLGLCPTTPSSPPATSAPAVEPTTTTTTPSVTQVVPTTTTPTPSSISVTTPVPTTTFPPTPSQRITSSTSVQSPTMSSDESEGNHNSTNAGIIVGVVCGVIVVLGAALGVVFLLRRKRRSKAQGYSRGSLSFRLPPPAHSGHSPASVSVSPVNRNPSQDWSSYHDPVSQYGYGSGRAFPPPPDRASFYSPPVSAVVLNPDVGYPNAVHSGAYYNADSQHGSTYYNGRYAHDYPYSTQDTSTSNVTHITPATGGTTSSRYGYTMSHAYR